jgi:hypothetical protein
MLSPTLTRELERTGKKGGPVSQKCQQKLIRLLGLVRLREGWRDIFQALKRMHSWVVGTERILAAEWGEPKEVLTTAKPRSTLRPLGERSGAPGPEWDLECRRAALPGAFSHRDTEPETPFALLLRCERIAQNQQYDGRLYSRAEARAIDA